MNVLEPLKMKDNSMNSDKILDRLAMLQLGNRGNSRSHIFLERLARSSMADVDQTCEYVVKRAKSFDHTCKVFIPPKPEDRVVMFTDNTGVYIFSDGFATPMGDISKEVSQWEEQI